MSGHSQWHLITSEYPPDIGGVSDFSFTLASALCKDATVHVWCPASSGTRPRLAGVVVHEIGSFALSDLRRLGQALERFPERRLFVQWTPQGFGYRSLNVVFATWLAYEGLIKRVPIDLMVHEPYLRWSFKPSRLLAAAVHRLMLFVAAVSAQRIWLSTTAWEAFVRPFAPRQTPMAWLPVPAPYASAPTRAGSSPSTDGHTYTVGHFGLHSPAVTSLLSDAIDVVLADISTNVLLIGRNSDTFLEQFLVTRPDAASRVRATGPLAPDSLTNALASCDVVMQPYPDGITARRTSTLTALARGVPTVTNAGSLSEPFWADVSGVTIVAQPDGRAIGEATVRLLHEPDALRRLADQAVALYDRLFDVRHATALLLASSRVGQTAG